MSEAALDARLADLLRNVTQGRSVNVAFMRYAREPFFTQNLPSEADRLLLKPFHTPNHTNEPEKDDPQL